MVIMFVLISPETHMQNIMYILCVNKDRQDEQEMYVLSEPQKARTFVLNQTRQSYSLML